MERTGLKKIKDFVSGESRREAERKKEMARMEEAKDIRLAKNPHLSEVEHLRLANSPYPFVRIALAHNCNIPDSVIEVLLKDPNPIVSGRARETFSVRFGQEGINPSSFYFYRFWLANRQN